MVPPHTYSKSSLHFRLRTPQDAIFGVLYTLSKEKPIPSFHVCFLKEGRCILVVRSLTQGDVLVDLKLTIGCPQVDPMWDPGSPQNGLDLVALGLSSQTKFCRAA